MTKFAGRKGDLAWGIYDYPVTRTQKEALDGLHYMMSGLPRAHPANGDMPQGYFCSQRPSNGAVVVGLHHHSVSVLRTGHIVGNYNPSYEVWLKEQERDQLLQQGAGPA